MTSPIASGGQSLARWLAEPGYISDAVQIPGLSHNDGRGQFDLSYRFDLYGRLNGEYLGQIHPQFESAPSLSFDGSRTVKRTLSLALNRVDSAEIDPVSNLVKVTMILNGIEYPLGRYVWADLTAQVWDERGALTSSALVDEGFIVDQPILRAYSAGKAGWKGTPVLQFLQAVMADVPVPYRAEDATAPTAQSWPSGSMRGRMLDEIAEVSDYMPPWVDYTGTLRFIRNIDVNATNPDIDYDLGVGLIRGSVAVSSTLTQSPNRIIVVGSGSTSSTTSVTGVADLPASAPHSAANRGYVVGATMEREIQSSTQALQVARYLLRQQSVYEEASVDTLPDPRYDGWTVVRWRGENWLSTSWTLPLSAGAVMSHSWKRVYI